MEEESAFEAEEGIDDSPAESEGAETESAETANEDLPLQAESPIVPVELNPSVFDRLTLRRPLRSIAFLGNLALCLDSIGNAYVLSVETGNIIYSLASPGALDAAFIDEGNIILGRSGIAANTPFQRVNMQQGETVAMAYPALVGGRVYRGSSGSVYGAVVSGSVGNVTTKLLRLNLQNPGQSETISECPGEDTGFSLFEQGGTLYTTFGGDGAIRFNAQGCMYFERNSALAIQVIPGRDFIMTVDTLGDLSWYNPVTLELLAVMRFHNTEWFLKKPGEQAIRGTIH